jgi:5'-nucleotidase
MTKPLILVCNDDGITAPGLAYIVNLVKEYGDVAVVAPDKPQSGMGHAITLNSTIRTTRTNYHSVFLEYSCTGTPVDCIKMAVNKLLPRKPDLCISGINHGPNSSINVIYSGTMSAAIEGSLEQIPSIGFSLCDHSHEADFTQCDKFLRTIVLDVLKNQLPTGVCLNVNIPKLKSGELKGIKICRQAKGNWIEEFDERKDPSGKAYYWLTGRFVNFEEGNQETDEWALSNGFISVVPTKSDLTSHESLIELKSRYHE